LQYDATRPIPDIAYDTMIKYNLSPEDLPSLRGMNLLYALPQQENTSKVDRRGILRFLGLSAIALAAGGSELIRSFDQPLDSHMPVPNFSPLLTEGDYIAGLENESFCHEGRVYLSRNGVQNKMQNTDGILAWQTLGSTKNSLLLLNNPEGNDVYDEIDLVEIDGIEYFRMTTIPKEDTVQLQCFENGEWLDSQRIPNTFRVPYHNSRDGRRIDWQNPLTSYDEVMALQERLLEFSFFFPGGDVPDVKVISPPLKNEAMVMPNYPHGNDKKSSSLTLSTEDLALGGSSWDIGILKSVTTQFLQNIDRMMYENNLSSYDPRTLEYVWSNIEEQLKRPSSLPRPSWWPKDKSFSLFDSLFHPGTIEGKLVGMDFRPTPENALASMLYISQSKELVKAVGSKFARLQKPELPVTSNSMNDYSSEDLGGWDQTAYFAQFEQGAITYLSNALTALIEHGTPPECSAVFADIKRLFVPLGIMTHFDPWSSGADTPLLSETVTKIYGEYIAGLSPEAVEAIQSIQQMPQ
jgi:hypothetical protein